MSDTTKGAVGAETKTAGQIIADACKPWEHYTGEPPDDGSPLSGVFVAGMVYTERLLAQLLNVTDYEGGDGSEDFDIDATQTLRNILAGAGLWDWDENCPVSLAPAPTPPVPDSLRALSEAMRPVLDERERWSDPRFNYGDDREGWLKLGAVKKLCAAYEVLSTHPAGQSAGSGAETDALVDRFSAALKVKLRAAEAKYGWKNGWLKSNWQVECQNGLLRHVGKGDPLDVAAYAAFCWHHGWPSASRRSTDFVTGAVIPTAGAIAAYETRYPEGSLSETSDNAIEAWNRVAAAVCLAEKPAPDSTRTDQVGVAVEQAVAKAAERAVEQLENAASGGLFHCEADREEAVEIVTEAIWTSPLAARPAAPEAQGAWRPMSEAPTDGTDFIAGLWVHGSSGARIGWQQHFVRADDETERTIHPDTYQGWDWDDYSHCLYVETPPPPAPPASSGQEG